MASCVCRSYNAQKMSCFLLLGTIFHKVNEMFTRVFQSKAYIFQHCFAMVNSSKFVETHFLAFYDLLLLGQPMENNRYSAIHMHSQTCIFRYFLCNGEFELIRARHAFSRVYRRPVNHCSSNLIQWISPPRLNHTDILKVLKEFCPISLSQTG